jgi:DNA-binding NarL/FixJ family response regulator
MAKAKTVKKVTKSKATKKTTAPVFTGVIRDRSKPAGKASEIVLIRRGTKQATVLELMDAGTEITKIVEIVGVSMSEVKHHITNLGKKGVGNEVKDGRVQAVYPKGRTVEDFFIQKAE